MGLKCDKAKCEYITRAAFSHSLHSATGQQLRWRRPAARSEAWENGGVFCFSRAEVLTHG